MRAYWRAVVDSGICRLVGFAVSFLIICALGVMPLFLWHGQLGLEEGDAALLAVGVVVVVTVVGGWLGTRWLCTHRWE